MQTALGMHTIIGPDSKPDIIANESPDGGQKARHGLRNWLMLVVGLGLLTVLLRHVSLKELTTVLSRADTRYLLTAFLAGLTATVFKAIRYACFFPVRGRWLELYSTFALMRLLNFVLPLRSGEVVFLGLLKKYRLSPSIAETAPVWLLLRVTDVVALSIWFAFAMGVASLPVRFDESVQWVGWVLIAVSTGALAAIVCLGIWGSRRTEGAPVSWLSQRFSAFRKGLERIHRLRAFLRTIALSMLIWGAMVMLATFAQIAFGTPLHFRNCYLVSVAVLAISLLPIHAPMGIGTGEAAWAGLMMMSGIDPGEAIAIAISIRLVSISVIMTDGLIGFSFQMVRRNRNMG